MLDIEDQNAIILTTAFVGLLYSLYNAYKLSQVPVHQNGANQLGFSSNNKYAYNHFQDENQNGNQSNEQRIELLLEIGSFIEKGAKAFLFAEYKFIAIFTLFMALIIFFFVEQELGVAWTTIAFLLGAFTSILAGYIGMTVAVYSNYRCSYEAQFSIQGAFQVAYRAGCVMGFTLTSLGVLVLMILIAIYNNWYLADYYNISELYECIAGYGLGGSTMALFGRVGGGIYTKAADVGADLVGKVEESLDEDSPYNPATIADNVGDNVGDIAGMGSDLFGSFAEATCAALVVASNSPSFYYHPAALYYPIQISAISIIVCLITTQIGLQGQIADNFKGITRTLKLQLIISTVLLIPALWLSAYISLPDRLIGLSTVERSPVHAFYCTALGLISGLIIGLITEYYTSHEFTPVQEVARACETGAATNIIYGLALGNFSTVVPVILLVITAFVSQSLLGMFGVALSAIGMLSNLSLALAIDAYGPVCDNAGGLAEMCQMDPSVRQRTDSLDAAGNTTAAIGKGFAIGSAALVSLSLFGAFLTRASAPERNHPVVNVDVINPLVFGGLLLGAMLPYAFSAFCIKSVGKAAFEMVYEIRRQFAENPGIKTGEVLPDYQRCIGVSTHAALHEMIAPGLLVLVTPLITGFFFGPIAIAGLLPGALVSGVSMALSSANSGGAWDNAKKYIESGNFVNQAGEIKKKGSNEHKAAVIGDTVGDPLKDTSGPALNILIKLMAIFSLVFCGFFDNTGYLQCYLVSNIPKCDA